MKLSSYTNVEYKAKQPQKSMPYDGQNYILVHFRNDNPELKDMQSLLARETAVGYKHLL